MLATIGSVITAIIVLGILILVHELGHFCVGRLLKLEIDEFAIGMGPKVFSKVHNGIRYSLRALPLGGYVRFYGEDENYGEGGVKPTRVPLNQQPVWKRFLAILAGAVMNLITAFVLVTGIFLYAGVPVPMVGQTQPGTPAEQSGMMPGDVVTAIDGQKMHTIEDVLEAFTRIGNSVKPKGAPAPQISVTVRRESESLELALQPFYDEQESRYRIGIQFGNRLEHYPLGQTLGESGYWMTSTSKQMVTTVGKLFVGRQKVDDMMGPVGIIGTISETVRTFSWVNLFYLAAIISLNLGIVNLLPIPALDGSRLIFLIIEAVRRKPINRNAEAMIHFAGLIVLFGFILFITFKDVARIAGG